METLLIPSPPHTAEFKSSAPSSVCSTPYTSAPSSPPHNFFFFNNSAPTSPKLYAQFTHNPSLRDANFNLTSSSYPPSPSSSVPFDWEESPGIPKNRVRPDDPDDRTDFEFDFSGQLDRNSLCADELFDGGKIKPLKPPPRLQTFNNESETEFSDSNRFRTAHSSPRSSNGGSIFYSPKRKQVVIDPFTKALEEAKKARTSDFNFDPKQIEQSRGRGMNTTTMTKATTTSFSHKKTRSLSPFRVADIIADDAEQQQNRTSSFWGTFSLPKAYRKWKIKDLLFRSASEGRSTEKLSVSEDAKSRRFMENSSFKSVETTTTSEVSVGSNSKRRSNRVPVSAHELHYKLNRAVSQEMRKKTYLPYKQGLLGCLGFVPGGGGAEVSRSSTVSMTRV